MLPQLDNIPTLLDLVDELDGVGQELVEWSGLLDAPGRPGGPLLGGLHPLLVGVVDVLEVLALLLLEGPELSRLGPGGPGGGPVGGGRGAVAWLRGSVRTGVRLTVGGVSAGGGEQVQGRDRAQQGDQH